MHSARLDSFSFDSIEMFEMMFINICLNSFN